MTDHYRRDVRIDVSKLTGKLYRLAVTNDETLRRKRVAEVCSDLGLPVPGEEVGRG